MKMIIYKIIAVGLCVGLCISIINVCQGFNESTSYEMQKISFKKVNTHIHNHRKSKMHSYDTSFDYRLENKTSRRLLTKQAKQKSQERYGEVQRLLKSRDSQYLTLTPNVNNVSMASSKIEYNSYNKSAASTFNNVEFISQSVDKSVSRNQVFASSMMFLPGDGLLPPGTTPGSEPTIPLRGEYALVLFGLLYILKRKFTH